MMRSRFEPLAYCVLILVKEVLGRSYATPDVDEADLEAGSTTTTLTVSADMGNRI